jgi:RNAse (barnase) inhibitor barstar
MAPFASGVVDAQRIDFRILQNGSSALYFRPKLLADDVAWLRANAYVVRTFDCTSWVDSAAMHDALATNLGFPDYYGRNLDALNDCLSDLEIPDDGGLALVLTRFDAFASTHRDVAQAVLDIIATQSRGFLLFGRRLFAMIQSDDPAIRFDPVGATPVGWNPKEWLNASRGL